MVPPGTALTNLCKGGLSGRHLHSLASEQWQAQGTDQLGLCEPRMGSCQGPSASVSGSKDNQFFFIPSEAHGSEKPLFENRTHSRILSLVKWSCMPS